MSTTEQRVADRHRRRPRHRRRHRRTAGRRGPRRRRARPRRGRLQGHRRDDHRGRRPGRSPSAPTSSDEAQVEAAVARVAEELGAPTVLVNNAGVLRDNLLFKMSAADWDTVMNVHLRGAFLMTKAVQKHMVDAELRPHRQPLLVLGARQPRPGQLLGRQGRSAGLHQDPRHRARQVRRHRQRRRPRLHRHRHDRRHRRPRRHGLRGLPGRRRHPDPGRSASASPTTSPTRSPSSPARHAGFVSGQVLYVAGGPLD